MTATDDRLKLATLNLRHNADEWARRAPLIVESLLEVQPHLIALQEVWMSIEQGEWLRDALNRELMSARYDLVQRVKWGFEAGLESVGVLTRLPLLGVDGVDLPGGRVASLARVAWQREVFDFVSLHLHFGPPDASDGMRRSQIRGMLAWLERRAEGEGRSLDEIPLALAGDFNATPDTHAAAMLRERWHSAYADVHGEEPAWTYGTPLAIRNALARNDPNSQGTLDYIFLSEHFATHTARIFCDQACTTDPDLYPSDHVGILAEVDLQPLERREAPVRHEMGHQPRRHAEAGA